MCTDKRYSVLKIKATHMDVIELDNTGEDRTEQREETERAEREDEETKTQLKPTLITYELGLVRRHLLKARLE